MRPSARHYRAPQELPAQTSAPHISASKGLRVPLKAFRAFCCGELMKNMLPSVPKGRMAEVVRQASGLNSVRIETEILAELWLFFQASLG